MTSVKAAPMWNKITNIISDLEQERYNHNLISPDVLYGWMRIGKKFWLTKQRWLISSTWNADLPWPSCSRVDVSSGHSWRVWQVPSGLYTVEAQKELVLANNNTFWMKLFEVLQHLSTWDGDGGEAWSEKLGSGPNVTCKMLIGHCRSIKDKHAFGDTQAQS